MSRPVVERRMRKVSGRQGRLLLRLITLCFALALAAVGSYMFAHSGLFEIREVVFLGNRHLSDDELIGLIGDARGRNLFSLSARRLAGDLLASPWVTEVSLRKELPGRLIVKLSEAEPRALLREGAGLFLLDGGGNVLEPLKGIPVAFLPVINGVAQGKNGGFLEALSLAGVINEARLAVEMQRVEITNFEKGPQNLTVDIDGLKVRVGKGNYDEKLARLFELKEAIRRRGIDVDYIDLRFADRVVVKPVRTSAEELP